MDNEGFAGAGLSSRPAAEGPGGDAYPARIAFWRGAAQRGDAGVEAADGYCAFAVFEIPSLPDFSSPRFPDLAALDEAQRIQRVGALQTQLLSALHGLGPRTAISLRYVAVRLPGEETRLRLLLIGRSFGESAGEAHRGRELLRETFLRSFPPEYRLAGELDPAEVRDLLRLDGVRTIVEIVKQEQTPAAWHEPSLCGFSFYYYPSPFQAAEHDMVGFCHALCHEAGSQSVIVDIALVPAPALTQVERQEIGGWSALCEKWGRDQRMTLPGGLSSRPQAVEVAADPQAAEAKKAYGDLLQRYAAPHTRCFLYGLRVMSGDGNAALTVASALAARALQPGSAPQMRLVPHGDPVFARALNAVRYGFVSPAVCNEALWRHPEAPETLRRLHRMVETREITGFFRLPIPGRDGCPGMALDTGLPGQADRKGSEGGIAVGRFVEGTRVTGEEARLRLGDLNKHGLIVGTPGSGKTSLCFSLLAQLWGEGVPFLVLEPAKTEYRALLDLPAFREKLLVFTVGNERAAPFRFNPFEVPEGVGVSEHIAGLNTCFAGAFNLFDPLPMLLDEAIRGCYEAKGWSEYGVGGEDPGLEPPTLGDLYEKALEVAQGSSYRGETAGNIRGALETRLGALLRGPKGRCFNTRRSFPTGLLLSRPVVMELESLGDDEKALLMMFLLARVRAHARSTRRSGAPPSHVVLVEEAHNVIGRGQGQAGEQKANPKEVAIRFFTRMLAEMRALGEGILIADQLPTAIAPEAIKSTNLKVMHRVVAADDRKELGQAMVFDEGQIQQAATLPPGHSFVFQEGWSRSRLVREPNFKDEHGLDVPPDDQAVKERMAACWEAEEVRAAYLPYPGCGAACRVCDPRVREQSERWAQRKRGDISEEIGKRPGANPLAVALEEYLHDFEARPEERVRWHCANVHFQQHVVPLAKRTEASA